MPYVAFAAAFISSIASASGMIVSQLEECRLKDGVDTGRAHTGLDTDLNTIDYIELDVVISNILLYLSGQMLLQGLPYPRSSSEGRYRRPPDPVPCCTFVRMQGLWHATKSALLIRYVELDRRLYRNRRWEMVTPPDFLES